MDLQPSKINRLALGLMLGKGLKYEEAVSQLSKLRLALVCGSKIAHSASQQAALLTAINAGKRAFLGGLSISLPENIPLLLRWPGAKTLNDVVAELSKDFISTEAPAHTILFGDPIGDFPPKSLEVYCSGWRGGVQPTHLQLPFDAEGSPDFATGGIFAGALAVHRGFLRCAGINFASCDEAAGISLWNPNSNWLARESDGPELRALPNQFWMLGLGHLGQGYLWNLGLLPFQSPGEALFLLQDFDAIEESNFGSGLLTAQIDVERKKTRLCSQWLEQRGFRTTICERRYDSQTLRSPEEPAMALCGFDKAEPRLHLECSKFDQILECGLGGGYGDFDLIHFHNFPNLSKSPATIWGQIVEAPPNPKLVQNLNGNEVCGALAIEIAGKAVSTSFVGAMAGALLVSELLRAYNRGTKFDEIAFNPRNLQESMFLPSLENYDATRIAKLGYAYPA